MIGFNVFIVCNSINQGNVKKQVGNIYLNTKCSYREQFLFERKM